MALRNTLPAEYFILELQSLTPVIPSLQSLELGKAALFGNKATWTWPL